MEVDLEYPASLHEVHNDYPLTGEKLRVSKDMLSPYSKSIRHKFGVVSSKYQNYLQLWQTRRIMFLITNICTYMFFLKLKKVRRVLEFDHSTWLKQYPSRTRASERLYLLDASHIYKHIHKGIVDEDEMDLLLITDGEKKHYVLTVKPVLSGHLSKSRKSLSLFTVNLTSVEQSPLLSRRGHPF